MDSPKSASTPAAPTTTTFDAKQTEPDDNEIVKKFSTRARARSKAAALLDIHKDEYRERKKAWQEKVQKAMIVATRTPTAVLKSAINEAVHLDALEKAYSTGDKKEREQFRYSKMTDRLDQERSLVDSVRSNRSLGTNLSLFKTFKQPCAEDSAEQTFEQFKQAAEKKQRAKQAFQQEWSS